MGRKMRRWREKKKKEDKKKKMTDKKVNVRLDFKHSYTRERSWHQKSLTYPCRFLVKSVEGTERGGEVLAFGKTRLC